jgi:hypothetical protein|tara:strand:+ start:987 stop:1274 length:288 start_codon:yes stop_codon:yes gene_type:complete
MTEKKCKNDGGSLHSNLRDAISTYVSYISTMKDGKPMVYSFTHHKMMSEKDILKLRVNELVKHSFLSLKDYQSFIITKGSFIKQLQLNKAIRRAL